MPDVMTALLLGWVLDLLLGDPAWLYHPVRLIGRFIALAEKRLLARGGNLRRSTVLLTASTVLLTMAAVETVAENTTDGVISPMLYAFLGGPVLLWGFKAASTLDSIAGYLDERYRDIGWASAKLDDALNFLPTRLTAWLMVVAAWLTGLDGKNAARIVLRDHANHLGPNCAWSEAAAAGALHIRLGGTHDYFGKPVAKPTIGDDDRPSERADIHHSVRLMHATAALTMLLLTLVSLCR